MGECVVDMVGIEVGWYCESFLECIGVGVVVD